MNLDNTHADYRATAELRAEGRDLFEGDAAVKAKGETYLYREANETDDAYQLRLKRAVLDPYVEKIVAARQAVLFRKEHTRELPAKLAEWQADVDRKGTPADVFFQGVERDAEVDGVRWVLVDMPALPRAEDGTPVAYSDAKAEKEAGHRPFMESIPADNVLDWEIGADLELDWAVVKQFRSESRVFDGDPGSGPWGAEPKVIPQWKVWTRAAWFLYEKSASGDSQGDGQGGKQDTYGIVDQGENTCGMVPLRPFFGIRNTDYSGWPVARSVFPHVLSIYNKTSDMDWFERLSAHPIPYAISPNEPAKLDASRGLWIKAMPGVQNEVGYLETTGQSFGSIRTSIQELQAKVYAIALAQAQKDSAQVQSGDSQREDRKIFTAGLRGASAACEAGEQRCWELMARWAKDTGPVRIAYVRDFDDRLIEATMIATLTDLMREAVITKRTLLETLVAGEVVELPDGVDKELAAVEKQEAENRAAAAQAALQAFQAEAVGDGGDDQQITAVKPNAGA
jgi:hypothetical protein